MFEHLPLLDDPFIAAMPVSIGVKYFAGITIGKNDKQRV